MEKACNEIKECPLCSSREVEKRMVCRDHYATGEEFAVVQCSACGFVFTAGVPDEAGMDRYYDTPGYISHSDTKKGIVNRLYHYVRGQMLDKKYHIILHDTRKLTGGTILDVGAGTGYFPAAMKAAGWKVSAVERNVKARAFMQNTFGISAEDSLYSGNLPEKGFDCITLWHVLEHLPDLHRVMERLGSLLKDDGTMVVAVPNCMSWDARHYGAMWAAYDVPRHLWHFTPDTLGRLAGMHGFEVKTVRPMPFDGFYVSMLSEKYKGSALPFVGGMMRGTQALLAASGHKERSSSLIYTLKRKI